MTRASMPTSDATEVGGAQHEKGTKLIPYRSPARTTVPRSLEKRLEIVNANRALAAHDDNDAIRTGWRNRREKST